MSEFSNWWNPLLILRPEIKKDDKGALALRPAARQRG